LTQIPSRYLPLATILPLGTFLLYQCMVTAHSTVAIEILSNQNVQRRPVQYGLLAGKPAPNMYFMNIPSVIAVQEFQTRLYNIAHEWPVQHGALTDEIAFCTLLNASVRTLGINGIVQAFVAPEKARAYLRLKPLLISALHHLNHVVGAWAVESAKSGGDISSVLSAMNTVNLVSVWNGGGFGPLHAAIWHAMYLSPATSGYDLWQYGLGICDKAFVTGVLVITGVNCVHGMGHGMLLVVMRVRLVALNYSACTTIPYASSLIGSSDVVDAIELCSLDTQMKGVCAGGVFDMYSQSLSPVDTSSILESNLTLPAELDEYTLEICSSFTDRTIVSHCFLYMDGRVRCLGSPRLTPEHRAACLFARNAECADVSSLPQAPITYAIACVRSFSARLSCSAAYHKLQLPSSSSWVEESILAGCLPQWKVPLYHRARNFADALKKSSHLFIW